MQLVDEDYDKPKPSLKNVKAKAIFDNIAENVDELAFRKGEILDVLEQNTDGLEGWWLCSLKGRSGLVPGNRLKILEYNVAPVFSTSMNKSFSSQLSESNEIYENTTDESILRGKRRSWHITPNKVLTPQKYGDVYLYDTTPASTASCSSFGNSRVFSPSPSISQSMISPSDSFDADNYDIPKKAVPVSKIQRSISRQSTLSNSSTTTSLQLRMDEAYDVPRPSSNLEISRMTPSSSNSSLLTSESLNFSLSSSNRSSLANMPDYDVPRKQSVKINPQSPKRMPVAIKELPLELSSALETLSRIQQEAKVAISKLLSFVNPKWRQSAMLEPVLMEIKLTVSRLKNALSDLVDFAEGTLGNSIKADDKNLTLKLSPLVRALRNSFEIVERCCKELDKYSWSIEMLHRNPADTAAHHSESKPKSIGPDCLDQLIVVAQTLTEDIRQIASFIQGNALLLFRKNSQTPTNPMSVQWPEDSDYVQIETEEQLAKNLPNGMQNNFESVVKSAEMAAFNEPLDPNDRSVLVYYASQSLTHILNLTQAIDSFLKTVEQNQPPKYFLNFGKFVILSGHNLVCIGDIVVRNLTRHKSKARILSCTDNLSSALKNCVMKTKKAAQNFPSVTAVQEMVDSVVDISHSASDLKIAMLQAINL